MDAGKMNRRVVIEARDQSVVDSYGQPVENWATFASLWAQFVFASGSRRMNLEGIQGGAMSSNTPAIWRVRFRTDITAAMRLVDGSTIYNIKQVLPNMARKDVTDIVCEVAHG
jgi:SPP1 family predicted phage head-tail adaptor